MSPFADKNLVDQALRFRWWCPVPGLRRLPLLVVVRGLELRYWLTGRI